MKIVKEDINNLERYIGNSKVGVHAELPLIMADAYEESKKKKEEIDKEMEEKAKDNVKLNKVIGAKKQPVPELPKQLKANLEESLFEDYDSDDIRDTLCDMIEDGIADAKSIAQDLIYWCSEDDIKHYMRVNDLISDDEDDDIDESLFEGRGPSKNKPKEDTDLFSLINQELVWENPNFISKTKFPNIKPKQRYDDSDIGVDYKKDGFVDITIRQPSEDKLDFAKKVANAYNAEIIGPASDGNNYILSIRIPD